MWIVRLALNRPYTFVVMALAIILMTPVTILRTPTDIFPDISIPVISLVYTFAGLSPEDIEHRITSNAERSVTTLVNDVEHIESQSLPGISVIKVYFQPTANVQAALAQTTAIVQSGLKSLPPGITPPLVVVYSASTVPILQIALTSETMSEQQLFDQGNNFIRTQLATVQGAALPFPYGGKQRLIAVDLDPVALQANGLSPVDIVNAVGAQNLLLPTGTTKIGPLELAVEMNGAPQTVEELNNLPVRSMSGATLYMRDVAHIRDGFSPQTNIVRVNGSRGVLMSVYKIGSASTLDIVARVKETIARAKQALPPEMNISAFFDQSLFVRAAVQGVLREALIAACLTAVMILLFLGDWRSTVIIAVSIPLSIMTSVIVLSALGQTINIMPRGGLALAVGILVDDATVEIENIDRNLAMGKDVRQAILDGSQQIAVPALVSTSVHLHRLRADVPAERRGEVPLRAPRRGRRLRHAGLLRPVPDARADDGDVPPAPRRCAGGPSRRAARVVPSLSGRVRAPVRTHARRVPRGPLDRPRSSEGRVRRLSAVLRGVDGPSARPRARLLPAGRRRTDPAPHACPDRPSDRGDRAPCRRG